MSTPLTRPATPDGLFLWVLHRFAEVFEEHAIVKGGIALRLLDCARSTTDIDYVFVPFTSKTAIHKRIRAVLAELAEARVHVATHSKMVRATVEIDDAAIQIEANVAVECPSTALPTAAFAHAQGQPSRIVRVMAPNHALAHKLAAWNERRLLRDLYDAWYLTTRLGASPDMQALDRRLARIESRLPALRGVKRMSRTDLAQALRAAADNTTEKAVQQELAPLLPSGELAGLWLRIRAAVLGLADHLES